MLQFPCNIYKILSQIFFFHTPNLPPPICNLENNSFLLALSNLISQ